MARRTLAPHPRRPRSWTPWIAMALGLCGLLLVTLSIPRPLRSLRGWRHLASMVAPGESHPQAVLFATSDDDASTRWSLLLPPPHVDGDHGHKGMPSEQGRKALATAITASLLDDPPRGFTLGRPLVGRASASPWIRYPLMYEDREVLGGSIQINFDGNGRPWILRAASPAFPHPPQDTHPVLASRLLREPVVLWLAERDLLGRHDTGDSIHLGPRRWLIAEGELRGVREVHAALQDPPGDWLFLVDEATGRVLHAKNRILHRDTKRAMAGTTGLGAVFDSNPLAASGRWDLRWGDDVQSWIVLRNLLHLDDSGWLQGDLAVVRTGCPPRVHRPDFRFLFSNTHPAFCEVMAYYHIDRTVAYLDSLDLLPRGGPFHAKVHATLLDNSWYRPSTGWLEYGDGGVPDAQDADIIIHELGHAVHDRLVPGFGQGHTIALSEGFSDYLACSRSGDPCLGEWDATAYSPPCLRKIDDLRLYPDDITGNAHTDGLIWASALWEIRGCLGTQLTDVLALTSLAQTSPWTTFEEAGLILATVADQEADQVQAGSSIMVRSILEERGLLRREATLELAKEDRVGVPLTFPFPVGDSLSWGLEISGEGCIALRDLPPEDFQIQGDTTLLVQPLKFHNTDPSDWRLSYAIRSQTAWLELVARLAGTVLGRATLELDPTGEIRLGWGGEGQGMEREIGPLMRSTQAEPETLNLLAHLPCEARGFVHSCPDNAPLGEGLLLLTPRHDLGDAPVWTIRWERSPTLPVPSSVGRGPALLFAPTPMSQGVEVRAQLTERLGDVTLELVDVSGRRVGREELGEKPAGLYTWKIPSPNVASGIYWVVLRSGERRLAKTRVLLLH